MDDNYFGDPIDDNEDVECINSLDLADVAGIVSGSLLGLGALDTSKPDLGTSGVQQNPGWALSYLSSPKESPSGLDYAYIDSAGEGVDVYIIDSGIAHNAAEFGNRVIDEVD